MISACFADVIVVTDLSTIPTFSIYCLAVSSTMVWKFTTSQTLVSFVLLRRQTWFGFSSSFQILSICVSGLFNFECLLLTTGCCAHIISDCGTLLTVISKVSLGSSCNSSTSFASRIPTTNLSQIISSLRAPYSQCSTNPYSAVMKSSKDSPSVSIR